MVPTARLAVFRCVTAEGGPGTWSSETLGELAGGTPALPGSSWRASTVLRPRIGTMNHAGSPSPALRAPSPPLGERDGVRGFGSWRASTVLQPRIGTMNHAESPSLALRAPSPPLGERDGVRGFGSWRASFRFCACTTA